MAFGKIFPDTVGTEDVGMDFLPVDGGGVAAVGGMTEFEFNGLRSVDAKRHPEGLSQFEVGDGTRGIELTYALTFCDYFIHGHPADEIGNGKFAIFCFHI